MSLLKTNEIQNYNGSSLTLTASTVSTSAQLNTGGNISVTGSLNVSDDSTTRTNLGLGTMATQNANAVAITGGTINTVQPATGQSLTIKDEDGNSAITVGTDNTAAGYLSLNFGSYHGGSGTLTGNTLDDYEEGTWTPRVSGTGGGDYTPDSGNAGYYVKVGNVVSVFGTINWSAQVASYSGLLTITGLPFSSKNSGGLRSTNILGGGSTGVYASGSYSVVQITMDPNNAFAYLIMVDHTNTTGVNYSHYPPVLSSGSVAGFHLTYYAS